MFILLFYEKYPKKEKKNQGSTFLAPVKNASQSESGAIWTVSSVYFTRK